MTTKLNQQDCSLSLIYMYPLIGIFSITLNVFAINIFSRIKFKNTIFFIYFRLLIILDTISLIYIMTCKFMIVGQYKHLKDINLFWCKLSMISIYYIPAIKNHILIVISIDRWLNISSKFNISVLIRKCSYQIIFCITIMLINLLIYIDLFFSYINDDESKCVLYDQKLLFWTDFITSTLVSFILLVLFTSLIILTVFNKIRDVSSNLQSNDEQTEINQTITVITYNILYLLIILPINNNQIVIEYDYNEVIKSNFQYLIEIFLVFLYTFIYANSFVFNLVVNPMFKNELFKNLLY